MSKVRLDVLVHQRSLAASREKAQAMIQAGQIMVDGQRMDKPGTLVAEQADIEVHGDKLRYVSRGGLKLEKALECFKVDCQYKVVLDVGASTGGYTDCVLQNGARRVYAVDVGYGQLDWTLRNDPRVINLERTNIRYISSEQLPELMDIITIDVSFISATLVLPAIRPWLKPGGRIICLVKPQFEAGREKVGKKGVVRDSQVHIEVIEKVINCALGLDLGLAGITFSPVKGPKGNIEYLLLLETQDQPLNKDWQYLVRDVVDEAHQRLGK